MKKCIAVILTACMILSVLGGCQSIMDITEAIKKDRTGEDAAMAENGSTQEGSLINSQAEFKADIDPPGADEILKIADKYYKMARSTATAEELEHIGQLIVWQPDFSGKTADSASALNFSYLSAYLATYTDLKNVYLALNAAVFTFDAGNPVAAGNLASAIAAYPEDTAGKPLALISGEFKEFTADAAEVYKYGLSLTLSGDKISAEALPLLLNYGNFCIDTADLRTAKPLFEAALRLAPGHYPACEGMAAYWLAAGDKRKAEEILEKAKKPAVYVVIAKNIKNTSEEVAPNVTTDDDLPAMEEKLQKLSEAPAALATDFYEDLDPGGAADARRFVENLAAEWRYTAPEYTYLSQFSTLKAFNSGQGQAAFDAFDSQFGEFAGKYASAYYNATEELLGGMGLEIDAGGIDINDMIKNPEKYEDMDVDIKVKGLDEFINRMTGMAGNAEAGIGKGDTEALGSLASSTAPELTIFSMNPGNYANPTDLITQKYNMTLLMRKLTGYKNYFHKQDKKLTDTLKEASDRENDKMSELEAGMKKELEDLRKEHDSTHDSYMEIEGARISIGQESCDECIVKKHSIHEKYYPQMDSLAETAFGDATNYINTLYKQKLKPNIEAMYADCMRSCMLVSDPEIRKLMEDKINAEVYHAVVNALTGVVTAYSIGSGDYPHSCDCDPALVEELQEKERRKFEEAEHNKTLMENNARREFESGVIKESTPLYQRLDRYTARVKLMFFEGTWHPLKTSVKYKVEVPLGKIGPGKIKVGGELSKITEHVRNSSTYGGGLSASFSADTDVIKEMGDAGKIGFAGTLSIQGEVATDGSGNIVRADVTGTLAGSASAGIHEAAAAFEVSAMRGCKVSAELSKMTGAYAKPPNAVDAWDDYEGAIDLFRPAAPKKVLWSGEYKLLE